MEDSLCFYILSHRVVYSLAPLSSELSGSKLTNLKINKFFVNIYLCWLFLMFLSINIWTVNDVVFINNVICLMMMKLQSEMWADQSEPNTDTTIIYWWVQLSIPSFTSNQLAATINIIAIYHWNLQKPSTIRLQDLSQTTKQQDKFNISTVCKIIL